MKTSYGYSCVSLLNDVSAVQKKNLIKCGVPENQIIIDKVIGKNPKHPGMESLMNKIHRGDCIFIPSLASLGNNFDEILLNWNKIFNKSHCDLVVLDNPYFDTRKENTHVCNKSFREISIKTFDYLNNTRREVDMNRMREGHDEMRENALHCGRKRKLVPDNFKEVCDKYWKAEIGARQAARMLHVSHVTFLRWYKEGYSDDVNPSPFPREEKESGKDEGKAE